MKLIIILILFNFTILSQENNFIKVLDGLDFPEGPAWDGNEILFLSNCYGGFITKLQNNKGSVFLRASDEPFTFNKTNGMAFGPDGLLYACEYGKGMILRFNINGETEIVSDGYNGKPFNRPNDLTFNKNGILYFTDPKSYGKDKLDGVVYKLNIKSGEVVPVAENLAFPNGIKFSDDNKKLFVCESALNHVAVFDVDDEGNLSNKQVFIEIPGGDPDGLEFDSKGNLLVAHFGGSAVVVVSPEGKIINKLITPGKKPSNIEWGNKEKTKLYVTECETNTLYLINYSIK